MTTLILLLGAAIGVFISGFVSAVETGSYTLNRVTLRVRSDRQDPSARRLSALIDRQEDLLMMTLLGNTLADWLCTVCVTAMLLRAAFSPHESELVATAIVSPLLLVLGGIIPKDWFRREADHYMYALAWVLLPAVQLARSTGFVALMRFLTQRVVQWVESDRDETRGAGPRTRVLQLLHEGALRGGLTIEQSEMIERVMSLSRVRVARVMIPRARAAMVPVNIPREDFLRIARMAHFSRLPVHEPSLNRVIGVVNVYDVLTDDQARPIRDHVRPALHLSPHEPVPSALVKLQDARQAMATINDRAGNCMGILTVKDLVEEIVGDLAAW